MGHLNEEKHLLAPGARLSRFSLIFAGGNLGIVSFDENVHGDVNAERCYRVHPGHRRVVHKERMVKFGAIVAARFANFQPILI